MKDTRIFKFKKDSFSKMTIDVVNNLLPCLEQLPILSEFPELVDPGLDIEFDNILRYIVLMYDPGSPLTPRITDMPSRKFNALFYAGIYAGDDGEFSDDVLSMVQCLLPSVNSIIYRYARFVWNDDYATLLVLYESYERLLAKGFSSSKDFDASQDLRNRISSLTTRLFAKDKTDALRYDFFDYLLEESLNIRPEDIAVSLSKGDDPIPQHINPYNLSRRKHAWISQLQR